jgi:hypothetical protein
MFFSGWRLEPYLMTIENFRPKTKKDRFLPFKAFSRAFKRSLKTGSYGCSKDDSKLNFKQNL